MPLVEFPYSFHKGYLVPMVPIVVNGHKLWAYVDSGATFSIFDAQEAERLGVNFKDGKFRMIIVGDGSFIPVYFHNLPIQIGDVRIKIPLVFQSGSE